MFGQEAFKQAGKVGEATGEGLGRAGKGLLDTPGMVVDATRLSVELATGTDLGIGLASSHAKDVAKRLSTGESAMDITEQTGWGILKGATNAQVIEQQLNAYADYTTGRITLDEMSDHMASAAGEGTANALFGKAMERFLPRPIGKAKSGSVGEALERTPQSRGAARQAAWAQDLDAINATVERLGLRALKKSGGNWQASEALFERYLGGVEGRLRRTGSQYGVETQPAALPGGERVPNYIYLEKLDGTGLARNRWGNPKQVPYPGSRRLDAAIVDLESPGPYHRALSGFDITLNARKPNVRSYYQEAFPSMQEFFDIRLRRGTR